MAVKIGVTEAEFTALDKVLQAEYKKGTDGIYYLEHIPYTTASGGTLTIEDVGGLKKTLEKERDQAQALEARLKVFEGLDPVKAKDALKKVDEMASWTPEKKVQEQMASMKLALEEKFTGEKKVLETSLAETQAFLQRSMINESATRAITAAKGSPTLLLPHVERQTRLRQVGKGYVVEILNSDGSVRISPKAGSTAPMVLEELIEEMSKSTEFARAFDASGASGSGNTGASGAGSTGAAGSFTPATKGAKAIRADDSAGLSANLEDVASGKVTILPPSST